ncbi:MAG: amidoligase family protein, partial [Polyangiaceae bacterium]|nr:amidoligase family protein [Polyangiaceae bacterium]
DLSEQVENWPLVKARPAFHYRLPNCELAQSGWSPALDWNRWVVVERLANTKELLEELSNAYLESDDRMLLPGKSGWTERVHEKLPAIDEAARTS